MLNIINAQDNIKVRYERNQEGELVRVIVGYRALNLTPQFAYDSNYSRTYR